MTDAPLRNAPYEDEDLRQAIDEIEEMEAEKRSVRAEAAGTISQIAKRIKNKKTEAKDAAGIPTDLLNVLLEQRALERKQEENAERLKPEHIELYEEASGQFSVFAPVGDERDEPVVTPATKAAQRAKAKAAANEEREQREGAEVLADLVH